MTEYCMAWCTEGVKLREAMKKHWQKELQNLWDKRPLPVDSYGENHSIYDTSELDAWFAKLKKKLGVQK
jgi:hypothetical protein